MKSIILCALLTAASTGTCLASNAPARPTLPAAAQIGSPGLSPSFRRTDVRDAGRLSDTAPIHMSLYLKYQHEAELRQLVANMSTRGTSVYHHYLTPAQFRAYFAASTQQVNLVGSRLAAAGFRNVHANSTNTELSFDGQAAQVNRFFQTELHNVVQAGRLRYASKKTEVIPSDIAPLTLGVSGLDNLAFLHANSHAMKATQPAGFQRAQSSLSAAVIGGPAYGPAGGYGPATIAEAYNIPANYGYTGGGRTVGIIGAGNYSDTDLNYYLANFQVNRTAPIVREDQNGGGVFDPYDPNGQSFEATLDVQTIAALAPGARIVFKDAPAPLQNSDFLSEMSQLVDNDRVDIVSISYAGCEGQSRTFDDQIDTIMLRGASYGTSFVASTGDYGYQMCPVNDYVNMPASDPNAVAVGGTMVGPDGSFHDEKAWQECCDSQGYVLGTSGGSSPRFLRPYWQGSAPPGGHRDLPDISFAASGAPILFNGSWGQARGTSWSAPIFASILVEINQQQNALHGVATINIYNDWYARGYNGSQAFDKFRTAMSGVRAPMACPLSKGRAPSYICGGGGGGGGGTPTPTPRPTPTPPQGFAVFRDVVSGTCSGSKGVGGYMLSTGGYDLCTGIGSANGEGLALTM